MSSSSLLLWLAPIMRGATHHRQGRRVCVFPISFLSSSSSSLPLCNLPQQQQKHAPHRRRRRHYYYTNTDTVKRDDPYQQLGLQWGDGATSSQIRQAYRRKAAELHPDVNRTDSPATALRKFQDLQRAYQTLIQVHSHCSSSASASSAAEWSVSVWRNGDRIAMDRTDVAGIKKQRPKPSPTSHHNKRGHYFLLGHPDGSGRTNYNRGEYLTAGDGDGEQQQQTTPKVSSSVGRGINKWVQPKAFVPWNGGKNK